MDVDSTRSSMTSERSTGQLDSLELIHLEELRLLATANPLDLDADLDADLNAETATASPQSGIPVDVTCNGPFRFDFQQLQLTLEDNVELTIQQPGKQPDQLSCQRKDQHKDQRENQHKDQRENQLSSLFHICKGARLLDQQKKAEEVVQFYSPISLGHLI